MICKKDCHCSNCRPDLFIGGPDEGLLLLDPQEREYERSKERMEEDENEARLLEARAKHEAEEEEREAYADERNDRMREEGF